MKDTQVIIPLYEYQALKSLSDKVDNMDKQDAAFRLFADYFKGGGTYWQIVSSNELLNHAITENDKLRKEVRELQEKLNKKSWFRL